MSFPRKSCPAWIEKHHRCHAVPWELDPEKIIKNANDISIFNWL